jgi:hypothetical protein
MHVAQNLPRRCTRTSAVPSDVSGVFARPDPCYGPADKQLPKRRSSEGGRVLWGRNDVGRAGRLEFALLIAATLFAAGLAHGQNLAPNAEFDTDVPRGARASATLRLSGWTRSRWLTRRSGAALATNNAANATQGRGIAACITDSFPAKRMPRRRPPISARQARPVPAHEVCPWRVTVHRLPAERPLIRPADTSNLETGSSSGDRRPG